VSTTRVALSLAGDHEVVLEGAGLGREASLLVQVSPNSPAALGVEERDVADHE